MNDVPEDRYYSKTHEWVLPVGENKAKVGITGYAVEELGDITYLEVRAVGSEVKAGERIGTVESNKATEDIYAPVSGKIIEINKEAGVVEEGSSEFSGELERISEDPYGEGWIVVLETFNMKEELKGLMDAHEYVEMLKKEQK